MVSRQRLHQLRFPERRRAQSAVHRAVEAGRMQPADRLFCAFCGERAEEYHHYMGYEREYQLVVLPLCEKCHDKQPLSQRSYIKRDRTMQAKVEPTTLVEDLIDRQDALQMSDEDFARKLGVSRPSWSNTRRYRREPGKKIIRAAGEQFPDMPTFTLTSRLRLMAVPVAVQGTMVEQLIRKQCELGMTRELFADKLGVSHEVWNRTKLGTYPIGRKLIAGAQAQFPELFTEQISERRTSPMSIRDNEDQTHRTA